MAERRFGNLAFHPDDGLLEHVRTGQGEHLRPKAARLLECLLDRPGEVVSRDEIIESVWGSESVVDFDAGLAALLRELRQTLRAVGGEPGQIETVPRRGYRLNAPTGRLRRWRQAVILAAFLPVLVGTGVAVWLTLGQPEKAPPSESYRLAILPFEVFAPTEDLPEHADLLVADTLLAQLLRHSFDGLELIGRTSLRPYLNRDDVASAVARDLGVELLVEGAVTRRGESGWRVELRLLVVPPGRVLWSSSVSGEAGESLEVLPVARSLAGDLHSAWPELRRQLGNDRDKG